jgi:hypothetical protein
VTSIWRAFEDLPAQPVIALAIVQLSQCVQPVRTLLQLLQFFVDALLLATQVSEKSTYNKNKQ